MVFCNQREEPYKASTVVKGFMQKPEYADFVTGRLFALAVKDGFGTIQSDIETYLFKTSVLKRMKRLF